MFWEALAFLNANNFSKEDKRIFLQKQINWLYKLHQINITAMHLTVGAHPCQQKVLSHSVPKAEVR